MKHWIIAAAALPILAACTSGPAYQTYSTYNIAPAAQAERYTSCLQEGIQTGSIEFDQCMGQVGTRTTYSPAPVYRPNSAPIYRPSYAPPTYSSSTYSAPRATSRRYYSGPRGGCYYINSNGNKTYVDRSMCR